jgi:hypothetical protein
MRGCPSSARGSMRMDGNARLKFLINALEIEAPSMNQSGVDSHSRSESV